LKRAHADRYAWTRDHEGHGPSPFGIWRLHETGKGRLPVVRGQQHHGIHAQRTEPPKELTQLRIDTEFATVLELRRVLPAVVETEATHSVAQYP
jgi:hypothetical protein